MIVDDERIKVAFLAEQIRQLNPSSLIHSAENGKIALQLIRNISFDLIIMDWEMPVMNGIETSRIMKADQNLNDSPILMVTGKHKTKKKETEALEAGVDSFLSFPFKKEDFQNKILELVNKQYLKQHNRSRINLSLS